MSAPVVQNGGAHRGPSQRHTAQARWYIGGMEPSARNESLEYGGPVPVHRRRWVHRWLIGAAAAIVVGVAPWYLPGFVSRVRVIYWQGKCLSYEVPADQPVNGTGLPECYTKFAAAMGAQPSGDLVFMHQMQGREPLLVCITTDPATSPVDQGPNSRVAHVSPDLAGRWPDTGVEVAVQRVHRAAEDAKFYGGRIDPEDPTHLTIDYEADGKKGVIDAWLLVDGLRIQMREPPPLFRNTIR